MRPADSMKVTGSTKARVSCPYSTLRTLRPAELILPSALATKGDEGVREDSGRTGYVVGEVR